MKKNFYSLKCASLMRDRALKLDVSYLFKIDIKSDNKNLAFFAPVETPP